jgi:hypothetical protein
MSAAAKGRTLSPETRAKISAVHKGRTLNPEHRAKIAAAQKGRTHSPETRAKIAAANKRRFRSPEHRARIAAALKGRPLSPEHRARIAAALKGREVSPETRARLSAAQKGRTLSPEHRAKLSAARPKGCRYVIIPSTRADQVDRIRDQLEVRRPKSARPPAESPAPAQWKPAVILGRPKKPALVWGNPKEDPTPLGRAVLKALVKAEAKGLSPAEIEAQCKKGGWRETLKRLRKWDPDWRDAIHFPKRRNGRYRIANAAEPRRML